MNCTKCQDLLSDYLDDALGVFERAQVKKHLEACLGCSTVRGELEEVVGHAREAQEVLFEPPNSRALWLRIRNTVEADLEAKRLAEARAAAERAEAEARAGSLGRLARRRWELSLPQLAASVAALVLVVSALALFGVRGLAGGVEAGGPAVTNGARSGGLDPDSASAYRRARLQQQQTKLSYWRERAEMRKASWNAQMRNAFDRSVNVYDDTISESIDALERDPRDEVSQEVLNTALREKMELLREFSEQ